MNARTGDETREGVSLTNLDQPLFEGANATKRDLVDYLDGVRDRIIPVLEERPLSVIRVHRGAEAFMQKNVPKYTPSWVPTIQLWADTSKRDVSYALCNDRRTLLWFANQRAVEYHPTLARSDRPDHVTHVVLDLDPISPSKPTHAVVRQHPASESPHGLQPPIYPASRTNTSPPNPDLIRSDKFMNGRHLV
jgi:bifunctional non-homologous end joining protein LigD